MRASHIGSSPQNKKLQLTITKNDNLGGLLHWDAPDSMFPKRDIFHEKKITT